MNDQTIAMHSEILRQMASEVMDVSMVSPAQTKMSGGFLLQGHLRIDPQTAYTHLATRFQSVGYTPLLQKDGDGVSILAFPGTMPEQTSRLWLALLLFVLTIASTIFMGGWQADGFDIGLGLAFSIGLLSILLAHELGHYLMARHLGVSVSYPFFIPMPLSPIGTMGAFIAMKSPPPDRRALLWIGIAGPIAGLIIAIPVLFIGLSFSHVELLPQSGTYMMEGNSLLYVMMKLLMFGQIFPLTLPEGTMDVMLHPVAFAGWVGLLVTGLNLLPAGQLDGGHILYALVGSKIARYVTMSIAVLLLVGGFLWWEGWFVWAILIVLLGRHKPTLLNELVPLTRTQQVLAIIGLVIFVLVFTPIPLKVVGLE